MKIFILFLISLTSYSQNNQKCLTFNNINIGSIKNINPTLNYKKMDKPLLQKYIISQNGFFKIFYDTTNANGNLSAMVDLNGNRIPNSYNEYIKNVSEIFDSVYTIECNLFKFTAPPKNNYYEIFVVNLPDGVFGYTDYETEKYIPSDTSNKKYYTFIVVDNDFGVGYRTIGKNALKVTAAHEFFHAIQIGNYGVWERDFYIYEMFAETFEYLVFPYLNDFLFDTKTYFDNVSQISLMENKNYPGYERAIFGIYLFNRFRIDFIKDYWNKTKSENPISALKNTIRKYNSSLEREFCNFSFYNFYSSEKQEKKYYSFGNIIPKIKYSDEINFSSQSNYLNRTLIPYTSHFYSFTFNFQDKMLSIVSNTNYENNLNSIPYSLEINKNSVFFSYKNIENWSIINLNESYFTTKNIVDVYPNPFKPLKTNLKIPVENHEEYNLKFYNSLYENIYSDNIIPQTFTDKNYLVWNGINNNGKTISSGIYYYQADSKNKSYKGKFAVVK